jgi:hypothetical protein
MGAVKFAVRISGAGLQLVLPSGFRSLVEILYIIRDDYCYWLNGIGNSQCLELFHLYTAVKDLYISYEVISNIAPALQKPIGERVTEVLPALQSLFLEKPLPSGSVQEAIDQFVAARQLADHPIAVYRWEREKDEVSSGTRWAID